MSLIVSVRHALRVLQNSCFFSFMNLLFLLPPSPLPYTVRLSALFFSPSFSRPPPLSPSSSPGCVWWTDVIISTSFIPPSSKQGDDCIYQALVCLRDASGTVVLHSQSEESSAGKEEERLVSIWQIGKLIVEITIFLPSLCA